MVAPFDRQSVYVVTPLANYGVSVMPVHVAAENEFQSSGIDSAAVAASSTHATTTTLNLSIFFTTQPSLTESGFNCRFSVTSLT